MIHMSKKCILACLLAVMLMLLCSVASAQTGTVTATSLILRAEATSDSAEVKILRNGAKVNIVSKVGKWYKVTYGNYEGYVYSDYIALSTSLYDEELLKKGDKGDSVRELQNRLKELGYYKATCDGNFGAVTETAVKAFQLKNGLTADGVVEAKTLKKLASASAVKANGTSTTAATTTDGTLKKGASGTAVKELQTRLKALGYYSNSIDGNYGAVTVNAVKAFQTKNGLTVTGTADAATLKKLASSSAVSANGKTEEKTQTSDGTLKQGDKGDAVKALQTRLKELGYYTPSVDGSYGYRTVEAVKAFQAKNGLTADGVAGPSTQKKLNSNSAVSAKDTVKEEQTTDTSTLKQGDKGDAVKKLQTRLKELGYYTPSVDGSYGYRTVESIKAFQAKNGLTADGVAGPSTQKKLYSASAISAKETVKEEETTDTSTLKQGSSGDAVKKLQTRLKELGYYSYGIDGNYGYRTVESIKAFQAKNGLTADGVAGPSTQKKLYSDSAVSAKDAVKEEEKEDTADTSTLKQGASGDAVKKLQTRLKELGYYSYGIDGNYGYRTVESIKAFQKKNGLTADGVAGPSTQKKLYSDSAVSAKDTAKDEEDKNETTDDSLKQGATGDAVKAVQKRLKELGYYSYGIDGSYGYRTVEAVKAFQTKNGLTADGVVGEYTLKKLNSDSAIPAKGTDKEEDKEDDKIETDDGTLKQGASGEAVKTLQKRLKELGYYSYGIDGSYGYRTVEAVKAFQKKNGLTADGVAGETTLKKLNSDSAISANASTEEKLDTSKTLKKGDSGAQVKALQTRLKELGYYNTTIDSDYGYKTAEAVSAFQKANGLNVTGTADSTTLKKLVSSSAISKSEADKKEEEEEETYVTERLDWFAKGASTFSGRPIIQIKDVKTGLVFKGKVLYGTNHLDVEPLTAADTAILLKINGGKEFSYVRRPMLVLHNGHVYAASIYSEPHGEQTITNNNFDGQFCLHFYGSKLHLKNEDGVAVVDEDHQACVAQAMKATW